MTKCVIYTRFSPRKNAKKSESCEIQEAYCRTYADGKGYEVKAVFADKALSGKNADRPGLQRAVKSLQRGDVLLVYKRDRLARDVMLAELTRRQVAAAGASIEAVQGDIEGDSKNPTVVFVRQIMDAVAELERKQIALRTSDAMLQHQVGGKRMGLYAPYGYKFAPDEKNLIKYEPEQLAIKRIKELKVGGRTEQEIMNAMNDEMPGQARKGKWNWKTIKKILARQFA